MKKFIHNHIYKTLPKIALFSILEVALIKSVYAQALPNPIGANDFGELVIRLAKAITAVGVPIAAIFIIYSGFLFVSSRGDAKKLEDAKNTFFWTIIGTLLIVGAWAIALALSQFAKEL